MFPGKDIYVGRGPPKGFEAAKMCGLPNVLTFTAGDVSQIHIYKLMGFMSDELKEEAVKYGKGFSDKDWTIILFVQIANLVESQPLFQSLYTVGLSCLKIGQKKSD